MRNNKKFHQLFGIANEIFAPPVRNGAGARQRPDLEGNMRAPDGDGMNGASGNRSNRCHASVRTTVCRPGRQRQSVSGLHGALVLSVARQSVEAAALE